MVPDALTYRSYLRLDDLLACQVPRSPGPAPDEMLFIIVHQAFELWFKQATSDLEGAVRAIRGDDLEEGIRFLDRFLRVIAVWEGQISVIEGMRPADFLAFRSLLKPASGLQSAGFREMEILLGRTDAEALAFADASASTRARLEARRAGAETVWGAFVGLLGRRDRSAATSEGRAACLKRLYETCRPADLYRLAERMVEIDERFWLWRCHHVRMAERMIGHKAGTGAALAERYGDMGRHGVPYLESTLRQRLYPELWAVRSSLGESG